MRIVITGGGTGGHTSPAVAILEEMRARDPRLSAQWVGCANSVEERVAAGLAIPFRSLPVQGWPRTRSIKRLWVIAKLALGVLRAFILLKKFRPQIVLGVGGYVSVPLTWAAQKLGIPTVLHEQNKRLGLANRMLARNCTRLLLSYADTQGEYPKAKAVFVGNPVRSGFGHPPTSETACEKLGLDPTIPVVLVCGGSQGAHRLNEAMNESIRAFTEREAQFIWMTGPTAAQNARAQAAEVEAHVEVFGYIDDMVTACAAATLIVSRAGASSTAEICMLKKPSILVPYPHATDNHQEQNARAIEQAGAAVILLDEDCSGARLTELIRSLLADPKRLNDMGEKAAAIAPQSAVESIVEHLFLIALEGPQ